MSDFVPRDILPDLWDEILKRHWTFLETDESMQKLEERRKLEGCLKEFLCVVPHDRKFFLPETAHVLRKTIRELDEFTAYKAIIGFESISQYANNLFTKAWRKEFRALKTYCGFFQHEIKSNLIDAEKLFEAMGYRRLSDEILVLDGPICPDQVTNVSRDAMAAYVECQIMKNIYAGLVALGLTCSWQDVFHYREKYTGGSTQAIKGLAYAIQEHRLRKEKLLNAENCYATIQHSPQGLPLAGAPLVSQCQNCLPYRMSQSQQLPNGQCALHGSSGNSCALHPTPSQPSLMYNGGMNGGNGKLIASYPAANYQQHNFVAPGAQPHMSHSRSLEHYNEPPVALPHRHSFDHQQQGCTAHHHYQPPHPNAQHLYESPYDCLDGVSAGSSVSYAAVAAAAGGNMNSAYSHPYNAPGNRYPLPFTISNQLNSHYATPTTVSCNGVKGDPYSGVDNTYAAVSKPHNCNYHGQQPPLPPARHISSAPAASKDYQSSLRQQRSFPPDQLIDFDDRAPLTAHDFHAQQHSLSQNNSFDYERDRLYEQRPDRRSAANNRSNLNATYAQPKDMVGQLTNTSSSQLPSSDDMYGGCVYARPMPRTSKTKGPGSGSGSGSMEPNNTTDKYLRNLDQVQDCFDNNRKMPTELKEVSRRKVSTHTNDRDTSDISYESAAAFDDFVTVGHSEHPQQRSPTQASKNQDGVGSFETWNYVYQSLERAGYTKDLSDRGDLLVQSLDLDSLNLANGAANAIDKRRSTQAEPKASASRLNGEKSKTLEKKPSASAEKVKTNAKQEKSILKQRNSNGIGAAGGGGTIKKTKSALKPAITTPIVIDNNNGNGNVNGQTSESSNRFIEPTLTRRPLSGNSLRASNNKQVPVATQVIVSSPNEWSCRFCTFLNPDTKRICEMCCRSKDFIMDTSVSNAPTCV